MLDFVYFCVRQKNRDNIERYYIEGNKQTLPQPIPNFHNIYLHNGVAAITHNTHVRNEKMYTLKGDRQRWGYCSSITYGTSLKGKNTLPLAANSFL